MSDPLIDSGDLAIALNDPSINEDRAIHFIDRAQTLCESVLSPLPDAAAVVVERVAARAYASSVGGRGKQITAAGSPFGVPPSGAVYLTDDDEADLRRLGGGGGAFMIDLLPVDYIAPCDAVTVDDWDAIS